MPLTFQLLPPSPVPVIGLLLNESVVSDFSVSSEGIKFVNNGRGGRNSSGGSGGGSGSDFVFTGVVLHESTTTSKGKHEEASYALGDGEQHVLLHYLYKHSHLLTYCTYY